MSEFGPALGPTDRIIEIVVDTDQRGPVQLTWQFAVNLDLAQHFLSLRDLESGEETDMWAASAYEFGPTNRQRRFQVRMTQGRSAPPLAYDVSGSLPEDSSLDIALAAEDPEGDPLTYDVVEVPTHGVVVGSGPNVTYVPNANYSGADSFQFRARDAQGSSNVATVTLLITPVNDPPQALPQAATTGEDEAREIALLATDVDGDSLTFTIIQSPLHGTLVGDGPTVIYQPGLNFNGPDSFKFSATDGVLTSPPALVSITVTPVTDPPNAAFTVPGEAANVAVWDNNLASRFEGAQASASSTLIGSSPINAIDDNVNTHWRSGAGQVGGATLTVSLPRGGIHRVGSVRLVNQAGSLESVRRFEVQVSTTTLDAGAFATVLVDVALNDGRVQEFALPAAVEARFVRLRVLENFGSATAIAISSFEVVGEGLGGVPSYSSIPSNVAAASEGARVVSVTSQSVSEPASRAIDGNASTFWTTATGQRTNQAIVIELAREKSYLVKGVRLTTGAAAAGRGVRNFVISVSTTTADAASFVDVLSSTAANVASPQEFAFPGDPVAARYVRLTAVDNHGSSCCISVAEFQVLPANPGGASFSSGDSALERVENMFDAITTIPTNWRTAPGLNSNQSVKFRLQAGRDHLVDRVRIQSVGGASTLKDFIVQVSATTDEDAAFSPVVAGAVVNNDQLQEFVFPGGPVRTRYMRLLALNNYGGSSIYVSTFQAVTVATKGSVVSIPASVAQVARNESPAQLSNGAVVLSHSSAYSASNTPSGMLDYAQENPWVTIGTGDQFALIRLAQRSLLTGVHVSPRLDCCPTQSVRDFEVWISDTTSDETSFSLAAAGTVLNNGTIQEFALPAPVYARYVKYKPRTNYGDSTYVATTRFDVVAADTGGVEGASSGGLSNPPALAFDGAGSTEWRTSTGAVANQWVTARLSGDRVHRIFAVRITPQPGTGPKNFEIRVSTTTAADGAFATVATGMLDGVAPAQEIRFGTVDARYVQFRWLSGYGTSFIGVRELEVLGALPAGAVIRGVSSQSSVNAGPALALDSDTATGAWTTAASAGGDQWMTLTLPGDDPIAVDRVALQGPASEESPRDFEIQVSTTTVDAGAFTPVFAGTLRRDGVLQNFFFDAAAARHIRLVLRDNYAGSGSIVVQNFQTFSPEFGERTAMFQDRSSSVDGEVIAHAWDFGDGGGSAQRDPAHSYPGARVYSVRLTASADTGLTGELTRPYRAAAPPVAEIDSYPAVPREGQSVSFIDGSQDPLGIVRREWNFGDGGMTSTAAPSTTHTFADNGVFTVTLTVTNSLGISASTARQVTVTNVAPTVTSGPSRRWVAGDVITFNPTLSDPGADTLVCAWDFGDGTTAAGCSGTHVYATPSAPTDEPAVFTAVLTVNDGDGGVTSSSVQTTVWPQRLSTLSSNLFRPVGIDWSPDIQRFVVANRYPQDQLVTVSPDGSVSPVLVSDLGNDEVNVVVSPGLGGFNRGDVYYNVGRNKQIGRVKLDLQGNVISVESAWATHPSGAVYGGITFDTQGGFGHDLLVVWQHGYVYRTNAAGQSTLITRLSGGEFEGATVAGPGFGPASGCLLTVDRFPARVWAICPTGAPFLVADMSALTQNHISWIRYVPAPGFLVFTDYQFGRTLRGDPTVFGADIAGHAVISTEYAGEVWGLNYDAASQTFKTRLLALAPNSAEARLEDITFVPGRGQIAPASASLEKGLTHQLTATVKDEAGFVMAGLPIDFVVTGANPQTGSATTDGNGVATFAYVGTRTGQDVVTASSSGMRMNSVQVTWTGNMEPTALAQSVTTPEDAALPITIFGSDPENETLVFTIVTQPQHGVLSGSAPDLVYSPAPDYFGSDAFTFTVTDPSGATSAPATVSIGVLPVNDAPTALSQSLAIPEDTFAPISLMGLDPEADPLTYTTTAPPQNGILVGSGSDVTYIPFANFNGLDTFAFAVADPGGSTSATATVSILVTFVNDVPVASSESTSTLQDVPLAILLTANDIENDVLTYSIVSPPQHGTLLGDAPSLTYVPNEGYTGPDSLTFHVTDVLGAPSNIATITINVEPRTTTNQPPVCSTATGPRIVWPPNHEMTPISILGVTDPEGGAVSITVTSIHQDEPLNGTGDGDMSPDAALSPPAVRAERRQNGNGRVYTLNFKALDPQGGSCVGVIKVCVPKSQSGKGSTCVDDGPAVVSTGGVQ